MLKQLNREPASNTVYGVFPDSHPKVITASPMTGGFLIVRPAVGTLRKGNREGRRPLALSCASQSGGLLCLQRSVVLP